MSDSQENAVAGFPRRGRGPLPRYSFRFPGYCRLRKGISEQRAEVGSQGSCPSWSFRISGHPNSGGVAGFWHAPPAFFAPGDRPPCPHFGRRSDTPLRQREALHRGSTGRTSTARASSGSRTPCRPTKSPIPASIPRLEGPSKGCTRGKSPGLAYHTDAAKAGGVWWRKEGSLIIF